MKSKTDLQLDPTAAREAINKAAQEYGKYARQVSNKYMVVINFREPSFRKRLYLVDLGSLEIVRAHHVAHGSRSNCYPGSAKACHFSNVVGSRKSSLGAMKTGSVYTWGKRFPTKRKLKLHGLEKRNSNVYARAIVLHSSNYVTDNYIVRNSRCGNSWGCPAVDPAICDSLINLIADGTFVYAYY